MNYITTTQASKKWGVTERTVRAYCKAGKIPGAVLAGNKWIIPENAKKPERNRCDKDASVVIDRIFSDYDVYTELRIDFTYNSRKISGSTVSHKNTQCIFHSDTFPFSENRSSIRDIIRTVNHLDGFNVISSNPNMTLNLKFIKRIYFGLSGFENCNFPISHEIAQSIIKAYNKKSRKNLRDIVSLYCAFISLDNQNDILGETMRLIMFKECVKNTIMPFVLSQELLKLQSYSNDITNLFIICTIAQENFREKYMA